MALTMTVVGAAAAAVVVLTVGAPTDGGTAVPPSAPGRTPTLSTNRVAASDLSATKDPFGIDYLQPSKRSGTVWVADWASPRSFTGVDPNDPWFDADHGSAFYRAGEGRLAISGETPRMYVHDPQLRRQWRDVEVTVYFQRVVDSSIPYAGMTAVARSNHLNTGSGTDALCDTRGYGARLRSDGRADFEKETAHPENDATADVKVWPEGLPKRRWIGYKFLVFDKADGVHLELWLDRTNGKDGGDWELVNRIVDDGRLFGEEPCASGVDPRMPLTNDPARRGSESGKPNLSVYFRSDGIGREGLLYKWASVREIAVP